MDWLAQARWSPYAVGIGIGVLSWFTWGISGKAIGCSTSFARLAGWIEKRLRGDVVDDKPYYRLYAPVVDWQMALVFGLLVGAFLAAALSGDFQWQWVPRRWAESFGTAVAPRLLVAFAGGVLLGLGARWADGCTSGHGISGTMQLAISSWVSAIAFFVGGIVMAHLMFAVLPAL